MGFVSRKRGRLVCAIFRGRKADMVHEFYYIMFLSILVVLVFAALVQHVNDVVTGLGFEKRFTSIDMALLTTTVYYAPGTLKHVYTPLLFEEGIDASFADSIVSITERGTELPPTVYWFLSNKYMDVFRGTTSLKSLESTTTFLGVLESYEQTPPNITYYKTGKKLAFNEQNINALQIVCPTVNTTEEDWTSKKVFVAKVLPKDAYSNQALPTNRISLILGAQWGANRVTVSGSSPSTGTATQAGSVISAIPSDADIVIAIGDSGQGREPGSLVVYIPTDGEMVKARKLACFMINELLTDQSTVFYAQIMPVFPNNLEKDSPLNIFKETRPDQVKIFLDISTFKDNEIDVPNTAMAILKAIERYYGGYDIAPVSGKTFGFTATASQETPAEAKPSGEQLQKDIIEGQQKYVTSTQQEDEDAGG